MSCASWWMMSTCRSAALNSTNSERQLSLKKRAADKAQEQRQDELDLLIAELTRRTEEPMPQVDIAQAQSLLGEPGQLVQVDVQVRDGAGSGEVALRIQERLGDAVRVVTPEQRQQDASRLLGAFRLNLTALSLISLLVGAFMVFTSTEASLVRRRGEFGLLRSLGAGRGQVLGLHAFAAIDVELKKLYEALAQRDLAAGSPAARRLFS